MKFIKTPVKGMCDILPGDMRLRENVLSTIKDVYSKYGFMNIETPAMEHIENLTSKQGGDNEKLIFKVLKRGRDLDKAINAGNGEFADNGLRYDLTVPLSRYYSNNKENLPAPFKALQIGNVWRADNPQKGRFRQFVQCDIDILGDETNLCEIELITATGKALKKILKPAGIEEFTVHVNDRRLLIAIARTAGFEEDEIPGVLISLDKIDKIGLEKIGEELKANGGKEEVVDKYIDIYTKLLENKNTDLNTIIAEEFKDDAVVNGLKEIIDITGNLVEDGVKLEFDPTLVRGMGYYTGPIFEVTLDGYNFSVAGGGRYDKMIGKFSGQDVPACGFSIGFERIITILKDHEDNAQSLRDGSVAYLVNKNVDEAKKLEIFKEAAALREQGISVSVQTMKKNMGHQITGLEKEGYTDIRKIYND